MIDLRHQDRASGSFPSLVRSDIVLSAVSVGDVDLQQHPKPLTVLVALAAKSDSASIPAVAQESGDSVITVLEEACDVISLILKPFVVAGPTGSKELIANQLAVDLNFIEAVAGHVGSSFANGAGEFKESAKHWNRTRF